MDKVGAISVHKSVNPINTKRSHTRVENYVSAFRALSVDGNDVIAVISSAAPSGSALLAELRASDIQALLDLRAAAQHQISRFATTTTTITTVKCRDCEDEVIFEEPFEGEATWRAHAEATALHTARRHSTDLDDALRRC